MKPQIINGLNVYTEKGVLPNAGILIDNKKIQEIFSGQREFNKDAEVLEFPASWHLIPGMIDMHIHGAVGADTMDATFEALTKISQALIHEGVTAFLATTMTESAGKIAAALSNASKFHQQQTSGAQLLGINLEGPFIAAEKRGAQNEKFIAVPDIELFKHWQQLASDLVKVATIAPEAFGAQELIKFLVAHNVIAACGHTNANYDETCKAISNGCSYATHLFNAMRNLEQRDPGAVTALLLSDAVTAEIIADGIHLHPAIVKLIYKIKGAEKIILVSDAMRAKGMSDGSYELGGQKVLVKDKAARLADGVLAGSVLTMDQAVRNMLQFTGCSLTDVIKMVAENPAKKLNIFDQMGSIACGKVANIVVLDEHYEVQRTFC